MNLLIPWFRRTAFSVSAVLILSGCSGGGDGSGDPSVAPPVVTQAAPATIVPLPNTTPQTASVNTATSLKPGVIVSDNQGNRLKDVTVVFSVIEGGGTLVDPNPVTNDQGVAMVGDWILGPLPGHNQLIATVAGLPSVEFIATGTPQAQPAIMMKLSDTDHHSALAGTHVERSPAVKILDDTGHPIAGIVVDFLVVEGNGTIAPSTVVSNAQGIAESHDWILGPTPGTNLALAMSQGLTNVLFTATGLDPSESGRVTRNRPDESGDPLVQFVYVVPSDGADRRFDISGAIDTSVAVFQNWLRTQTGGRVLRLDTYQGRLDIFFYRLQMSDAAMQSHDPFIRNLLEDELQAAGLLDSRKIYAVYYDGSSHHACGGAAWPPLLPGQVTALYLRGTPPHSTRCDTTPFATSSSTPPRYLEFAMLHEIIHTFGIVAENAPHHIFPNYAHVGDDARDLMYGGTHPWNPSVLDIDHDDYYGENVPAGVVNLMNSPYLTP